MRLPAVRPGSILIVAANVVVDDVILFSGRTVTSIEPVDYQRGDVVDYVEVETRGGRRRYRQRWPRLAPVYVLVRDGAPERADLSAIPGEVATVVLEVVYGDGDAEPE